MSEVDPNQKDEKYWNPSYRLRNVDLSLVESLTAASGELDEREYVWDEKTDFIRTPYGFPIGYVKDEHSLVIAESKVSTL